MPLELKPENQQLKKNNKTTIVLVTSEIDRHYVIAASEDNTLFCTSFPFSPSSLHLLNYEN
uniref:Uncharacterized protein n=1 Tax=Glossina pallidipes TaxID=7398 RepID=A0A1A9ZK42_GLOPL